MEPADADMDLHNDTVYVVPSMNIHGIDGFHWLEHPTHAYHAQ